VRADEKGNANLPIELLGLGGDVNVGVLLLCSRRQLAVPAHPNKCFATRLGQRKQASSLTEIIDVEDAADGAARPAVSDLAL
jgi:hypothetical protein